MNIQLRFDNVEVPTTVIRFSDGAVNYVIDYVNLPKQRPSRITFSVPVDLPINSIITELTMLNSALSNLDLEDCKRCLHLPFSPICTCR